MDLAALRYPFPPDDLDWRPGSTNNDKSRAMALAYLNARAIMDRLDEVCAPENWKDEYIAGPQGGVICRLSIRIDGEWVAKEDGAENTDVEPVKGGISDALKRAAVKWGVGRYLYNLPTQWVECETFGKSVRLKERPRLPSWALPHGAGSSSPVSSFDPDERERPPADDEHQRPAPAAPIRDANGHQVNGATGEIDSSAPVPGVRGTPAQEWDRLLKLMPAERVPSSAIGRLLPGGKFGRDVFFAWLEGHPGRSAEMLVASAKRDAVAAR